MRLSHDFDLSGVTYIGLNSEMESLNVSAMRPTKYERFGLVEVAQWLVNSFLLIVLLLFLTSVKNGEIDPADRVLSVLFLMTSLPVFMLARTYGHRLSFFASAGRLAVAWFITLSLIAIAGFATKTSAIFSREVLLQWAAIGLVVQLSLLVPFRYIARRRHLSIVNARNALIVAENTPSEELIWSLYQEGQKVQGYVSAVSNLGHAECALESFGAVENIREVIGARHIKRVYIELTLVKADQIERLYIDLLDLNIDVIWVPDFGSMKLLNKSISSIAGLPAIFLNESPLTRYPTSAFLKNCIDRIGAALGIIVLSPIMFMIAGAVKFSSKGPIIFRQMRHGWNGEVIEVWKFRTMFEHHDDEVKQATPDDSRVTLVGKYLRCSSLDELPQLFNVLAGKMSLVGPRPHALEHNDYYSKKINAYLARHRIKPGISGLAQVNGFRGQTDNMELMEQRIEYDLAYINNWSLWLDIKILLKTPAILITGKAY